MKKENEEKEEKFQIAYAMSLITQIGVTVSVITVSFIGLGYYADRYFDTLPVFVIIGAVLSFALSMFAVYRLVLPMMDKFEKEDKKE
ncbi:MAG: AtpZ/AtpI family protein [Candidatus Pacebacteria bacterium]|nr:AtpZ/AtpI family protein [Candidatus Paceibacterota bacterium]